eukprot:9483676-Pyramimonas_sp.AAC.1
MCHPAAYLLGEGDFRHIAARGDFHHIAAWRVIPSPHRVEFVFPLFRDREVDLRCRHPVLPDLQRSRPRHAPPTIISPCHEPVTGPTPGRGLVMNL